MHDHLANLRIVTPNGDVLARDGDDLAFDRGPHGFVGDHGDPLARLVVFVIARWCRRPRRRLRVSRDLQRLLPADVGSARHVRSP